MPSKNNLSALKVEKKIPVLGDEKTSKAGRKKKPVELKESETVTLKITLSELEYLEKKAGLVPLGTYVKDYLRKNSDIFG